MDAGGFELAAVGCEVAGIGFVVFAGRELRGVDEDAGGDGIALGEGGGDQREMAGVQRPHGGN
jgi:hypothetical protein